ncbi:MAG: hypothetical protein BGO49_14235 [Planctomycetales bacterium 71-10]|nr:MAG: hypothetical protein BGO49_14235 [Planctomycetales bacterium 71-10]
MTRKSGVVFALAAAPLLGGLLSLAGCDSSSVEDTPPTPEERNKRVEASTNYMREQYEAKANKKK